MDAADSKGMYDDVPNTVARLPGAGRPVVDAKVDQELHEWLLCQRQKGFRVTGRNKGSIDINNSIHSLHVKCHV